MFLHVPAFGSSLTETSNQSKLNTRWHLIQTRTQNNIMIRVKTVAKNTRYLRHVHLSVYPSADLPAYFREAPPHPHWTNFREILCYELLRTSVEKYHIWLESSRIIGHLTWILKNVLFSPATLNRHESPLFEWNTITLSGYQRRYKYYAKAP